MKHYRLGIIVALAVVLLLSFGHKAYAHYPASDGVMSAVLHVEPDDQPSAGQPQTIYFIFDDATNRFKLLDCDCSLSIVDPAGRLAYYAPLQLPPPNQLTVYGTAGVPFTFQSGKYQFQVTGKPLANSDFKPFKLNWSLPVSPAPQKAGVDWQTIIRLFAGLALLLITVALLVFVFS